MISLVRGTILGMPEMDHSIQGGGCKYRSIPRKNHRDDGCSIRADGDHFRPAGEAPYKSRAIIRAGCQGAAVGGEGERINVIQVIGGPGALNSPVVTPYHHHPAGETVSKVSTFRRE